MRLFNRGEEVAVYVEDQGVAGLIDGADFIEFYAQAVAAADAKYAAENIYWLTSAGGAGLPKRMATIEAAPIGGLVADDFADTARHEQDIVYWLKAPGADSRERWFFDTYVQGDEHDGGGLPKAFTLNVPDPVTTGTLKILMAGQVATEHTVKVVANGVTDTFYWSDIAFTEAVLTDVPLNPGDNTVTLQCLSADGNDSIIVDYFEVSYRRDYVADSNQLKFAPDSGERYLIDDFTDNALLAYDISDAANVAIFDNPVIAGENPYSIAFEPAVYGDQYLVVASSAISSPERLIIDNASTLSDTANGADYIIITHNDIGWDENGDQLPWLTDLVTHRENQGLRVFVADIEDIYDEFNYGIAGPQALKDFLTFAYSNWTAPAPQYVLLVGDGTYDPKDLWINLDTTAYLPAYLIFTDYKGETVSDQWFVTLSVDDAVAGMHIGRLPAADAAQAATMVEKIIAYETTANTKFVDPDAWEKNVLLIADNQRQGQDYAYEAAFEDMNDFAANLLPAAMADPFKRYLSGYVDEDYLTDDIIDAINAGVLMVNYSGHGATWIWAEEHIFEASDVAALTNTDRLPFFVSMSCESGIFTYPEPWAANSLAETLLRSDAGAVAALMPTGMTTTPGQEVLNNALFETIFTDD
ncbi:MAG: C25 family cysteine peptidase [Desulfobacterales bacterium]